MKCYMENFVLTMAFYVLEIAKYHEKQGCVMGEERFGLLFFIQELVT